MWYGRFLLLTFMVFGYWHGCTADVSRTGYRTFSHADQYSFYPVPVAGGLVLPVHSDGADRFALVGPDGTTPEWTTQDTDFDGLFYNAQTAVDDRHLIVPAGRHLIDLHPETGEPRWHYTHEHGGDNNLDIIWNDRVFRTYRAAEDRYVFADIDVRTGKRTWFDTLSVSRFQSVTVRSPVVVSENETDFLILVGTGLNSDGSIENRILRYVLSENAPPALEEIFSLPETGHLSLLPVPSGAALYATVGAELVCFSPFGKIYWQQALPGGLLTSRLVIDGQTIYAAAEDEYLRAFDVTSGNLKWKQPLSGTPGRLFVTTDDLWIVGGSEPYIFQLKKDGTSTNRYSLPGNAPLRTAYFSEHLSAVTDGKFWYVGTTDILIETLLIAVE